MKKIIAMALCLCAMLSALVACGTAKDSGASSSATTEASSDIALAFMLKNKTGFDMKEAYVYPTGASDKGENLLTEVWPTNTDESMYRRTIIARPESDSYDLYAVFTDGSDMTYTNLPLKFNNSVSLKETLGEITVKKDAKIEFTEEEIAAAGVTAKPASVEIDLSKKVPLKFMFKNKTGLDAKAAYIYPSGTTDKGENILTEVWPNNDGEDDYKWIDIERPDADVYDVAVEFTNGKTMLYKGQDLKNNNSASMKDEEGKLSLKQDSAIDENGKPVKTAAPVADDNAKEITLSFVFKNKTGYDASEAYVYASGASDKGENILTEIWKNNESDAQYLNLSLTRANAPTYEIHVVFTDGQTLTFKDLDLKSNNSASMKDRSGAIFLKYV